LYYQFTVLFSQLKSPSGPRLPQYQGFEIILSMTPLDKWLSHCRDLYMTTHSTHKRQVRDIYNLSQLAHQQNYN